MSAPYQHEHFDRLRVELPRHWEEKALKHISLPHSQAFVDGPFGSDLKSGEYVDEGIPLIQLNNIRDGHHVLRNMKFITEQKKAALSRHIARPGDLVFAKMAEPVARTALVSAVYEEYVIVADCVKMSADQELVDTGYLVWAINSDCVRITAELVSTGTTRIRISLGELKRLRVPFPPIEEQVQIANFLDYETAKIDALIEKQQQLIALLKEKRQAVISHAVTKGLNPDAPMRDSGVEWLGEVPADWELSPLGYLSELTVGIVVTPAKFYIDTGVPCLRSLNVRPGYLRKDELVYISTASNNLHSKSKIHAGDVVVVRTGQPGTAAVVDEELDGCNCIDLIIIRKSNRLLPEFLVYQMNSDRISVQVSSGSGGAIQQHFNVGVAKKLHLLVPSIDAQAGVVRYLDERTRKLDALIGKAEDAADLLSERRTALISAAVTGKIDVRG